MQPDYTSVEQALAALDDVERSNLAREAAAHFLAEHPAPASAERLVRALQDPDEGVRWAAGTALAKMGRGGMLAVLRALADPDRVGDPRLRSGAFHMLHAGGMYAGEIAPLVQALQGWTLADISTLIEANRLLRQMTAPASREG